MDEDIGGTLTSQADGKSSTNAHRTSGKAFKCLLEWERLKIMREQITKWNGKMPDVYNAGSGSGMLLNLPAPSGAQQSDHP